MSSPNKMASLNDLRNSQVAWARAAQLDPDVRGYLPELKDNLRRGLSETALRGFESGGQDLMNKMRALHSSSALVVNIFDYWANSVDRSALTAAMGLTPSTKPFVFESKHPTGLEGAPPNLDLVIMLDTGDVIAMECNFTEWLSLRGANAKAFKPKYFPERQGLWAERQLNGCQKLAEDIRGDKIRFERLDVPQLLKHALGLANSYGDKFSLWYLYYDWACAESEQHKAEIAIFEEGAGSEIDFQAMSYQELFLKMDAAAADVDPAYMSYLRERYFPVA